MSTSQSSALSPPLGKAFVSHEGRHPLGSDAGDTANIAATPRMQPQGEASPLRVTLADKPSPADAEAMHRPRSPKKSALSFSLPLFRLSRSVTAPRESLRAAEPGPEGGNSRDSASTPTTPRGESPRSTHVMSPSRRERANSSPQALGSSGSRVAHTTPDVLPSPRRADSALIMLGEEAAHLILSELAAAKPRLNKDVIDSLARFEIQVPATRLSAALRSRVDLGSAVKLSHPKLIKALFQSSLLTSEVGKTLVAMRTMVMMQYDGWKLTLAERAQIEERDLGFKARMQANIEHQAKACAEIALGQTGPGMPATLSASKLPPELIAFWRAVDRQLCDWAAQNPDLDTGLLRVARENLGFDILFTRLMLPIALGAQEESHLVIPMIFYDAVKNALKAGWPAFVDSFIAASAGSSGSPDSVVIGHTLTSCGALVTGGVITTTSITSTTSNATTTTTTTTDTVAHLSDRSTASS